MRQVLRVTVGLFLLLGAGSWAVTLDEMSEEARKLITEEPRVVVALKSGQKHEGILLSDTPQMVSIRVVLRGMSKISEFKKSEVESVKPKDVTGLFAKALLDLKMDASDVGAKARHRSVIALCDEFLQLCREAPEAAGVRNKRNALADEVASLDQGMKNVQGEMLSPVRGTLKEYEAIDGQLREMEKSHPGIDRPDYSADKELKVKHDQFQDKQREIARRLPELVRTGVGVQCEEGKFKDAVGDLDHFQKLWINSIMAAEAHRGGGVQEKEMQARMDFTFIWRLQKRILTSYVKAGGGAKGPPPDLRSPKDMVFIPGGLFIMGREEAKFGEDDFPMHIVFVEPFLLDRYEVSNREYNKFLDHVRRTGDASFEHPKCPPMKDHASEGSKNPALKADDQPVVGIDWFDAYAFAKWCGKRLPTEAEWEKAARGMKMVVYPWGNESPQGRAVSSPVGRAFVAAEMDRQHPPLPPEQGMMTKIGLSKPQPPKVTVLPQMTWPVNENFPVEALEAVKKGHLQLPPTGVSPYLIFHMAGNAAEWVNDYYDAKYYLSSPIGDPGGPENGAEHVFRGGGFVLYGKDEVELATYWRGTLRSPKGKGCTSQGQPFVGFRCAKSAETRASAK